MQPPPEKKTKKDFRNTLLKTISSYAPGEQPDADGWIKLNTNENPFAPSPLIFDFLKKISEQPNLLKRYPNPFGDPLRHSIAQDLKLSSENIFVGNGSDDALRLIFHAFLEKGQAIAVSQVTYSLYNVLAQQAGVEVVEVSSAPKPHNPFSVDLQALAASDVQAIFLPNPNAQTGELFERESLCNLITNSDKLWVIDEAYVDFTELAQENVFVQKNSLLNDIAQLPNALVIRTFSKSYALAGLRIGYAVGDQDLINALYSIKDSYNVNVMAAQLGDIAWQDRAYFCRCVNDVIGQRQWLNSKLQGLGFTTVESHANFILTKPYGVKPLVEESSRKKSAEDLYLFLKSHKVLIRYFQNSVFADYVRISIGTSDENKKLLELIKTFIGA